MNVVWFLIIAYYRGGAVAIPEPSKEQCLKLQEWVQTTPNLDPASGHPVAYCIPGSGR